MNTYKRQRFPPDITSHAVWLYYRFNLSHRDIEDLLAEGGIIVSREAIRLRCIKFGVLTFGAPSTWGLCPTKCFGYGEVVDVYLQAKRDGAAPKRFVPAHAAVSSLFNPGRDLVRAEQHRNLRATAFTKWERVVA
jgi:putative transposase